ncbi:hypothetical protein F9802_02680 [Bacillus aerolatus]|uniref:Uncharacterized protein n=1 Tax=Bacillus aerolatus TaxID=2653354 RepID=A0A6I1FQR0_9BACI|nr:hypothetical protein [Bacillus aerolatus]KAB7709052.1 hypothetical protein F9802_02680 [Bacillus aerolatus]
MKKYWKTILISLVIIITIGAFYIQAAMAADTKLSFRIETISGNEEEIENIILQVAYKNGDINRWLDISKDGTTDMMNQSNIKALINVNTYGTSMFQKLIEEHRNFMRGKELNPSHYFEDRERLIYTSIPDNGRKVIQGSPLTFKIDILDKKTNERSSFEINTPVQASYNWMNVNDIYAEDGKIKTLLTGSLINGEEELRIYTVDENNKEFENDSIIAKAEPEEGIMSSIRIFNDSDILQTENYYLYMVGKYKDQMDVDAYTEPELISSQMYLYNNITKQVEEWTVPNELKPYIDLMAIHGADIFIPVPSDTGLEMNRYNIEKEQWENPLNFSFANSANDEDSPFFQLKNGKLYMVNRVSDGHSIFIRDLRTGKSLYEGKIIGENNENLGPDFELYINQLYRTI